MATLNIGGTKVIVSDDFLNLPPDQQQATVEEIAASLGPSPGNVANPSPEMQQGMAAASQASQKFAGAVPPRDAPQPTRPDLMGATAATLGGIVNSIPIIGPMSQGISDNLVGIGAQLTGGDFNEARNAVRERREALAAANPIASIAGNVGGSVGTFGALGATQAGAKALGMSGNLGQRVANTAASTLGLSTADNIVRGDAPADAVGNALAPTAIASAIPVAGALAKAGVKAFGNQLAPMINSVRDPAGEAARRVGMAVNRDLRANPQSVMNATDEAVARQNNLALINVDRGGETTRALARSVANQSPEARAVIQRTADDRFSTQAPRAVSLIQRLVGGNADDVAMQARLTATAKATNNPAYRAAYAAPQARAIWTPEIRNLMQAGPFRTAIEQAEGTAKNAAAVSGQRAVINPFVFADDGSVTLRTMPDGSRALPNLEFWDIVQRNLRNQSNMAMNQGNKLLADQIGDMRRQLNTVLDNTVPQFRKARQGAAAFFGADEAIDAGRTFANQPRNIPEARVAFGQFSDAEKKAFAVGYASELIDKIKSAGDRRNIIQQMFGSPAAREMNELVFGPARARELEAFVRVEALADQLRGAMGNSTTARQLMELGIGGAGGFALTGDWQGALTGAALAKGTRYMGERVDSQVMEQVARLLTSDSPQALQKAVANAALSPKWMVALDQLAAALSPISRGANYGNAAAANEAGPLRVTVDGAGSYGAVRN